MSHLLKVLVELSTTTPPVPIGPTGFVFYAHRTEGDTIRGYWYSASLDGELRSSVVTEGKADERGIAIKGSGAATRQEIVAPAIKEAFQHEVDLWLRRTHLKKEWRNAQFSGGVLQKKRKPR